MYTSLTRMLAVAVITFSFLPVSALAATATQPAAKATTSPAPAEPANISQAVTHSFNADPGVQLGMIVKLKAKDNGTVEPLGQDSIKALLGVVVKPNDSTITLSPQAAKTQQVYVASNGHFMVLVSNQNGSIKPGDLITISALAGIGMKATESQSIVLGKAITAFNGTSNVIGKVNLKDKTGKVIEASLGRISVAIDITHNPLASSTSDKVPEFLAKAAIGIANKQVSTARIYLGVVLIVVSAFVAANVVYSGVRSGMLAIGRNPLSRKSIFGSLVQTVIAGLIIFIVGILAVYLLLKV